MGFCINLECTRNHHSIICVSQLFCVIVPQSFLCYLRSQLFFFLLKTFLVKNISLGVNFYSCKFLWYLPFDHFCVRIFFLHCFCSILLCVKYWSRVTFYCTPNHDSIICVFISFFKLFYWSPTILQGVNYLKRKFLLFQ